MKNVTKVIFKFCYLIFFLLLMVPGLSGCNESSRGISFGFRDSKALVSQARQIILEGLADESPQIRTISIEVVGDTLQGDLMPNVQKLLLDDYVPVRFAAAIAVGETKYRPAKKTVTKLLRVPDDNTKIGMAYALYKLGDRSKLEIIRLASMSKEQSVRANAAALLGKSGDKDQLKLLYKIMRSKSSADKVRYQAAESIAMLGDEEIFRKLWSILISVYADDRVLAIRGMGALGSQQARDVLITKLDDDVPEVRLAAAEQLGSLGETIGEAEVLDVFRKNLTSGMSSEDSARIRVRAALAIGQIGTAKLRSYLPNLLSDESKLVRIAASKAVLEINGAHLRPPESSKVPGLPKVAW